MSQIYVARYIGIDGRDHFLEFVELAEAIKEMRLFESLGCKILSVKDMKEKEYFLET